MTKVELENTVEVTYFTEKDKNNVPKNLLTAMVHVPEKSLPPISEEDKKCGGRLLKVYFEKAAEILRKEIGPVEIYPGASNFRFLGHITVVY